MRSGTNPIIVAATVSTATAFAPAIKMARRARRAVRRPHALHADDAVNDMEVRGDGAVEIADRVRHVRAMQTDRGGFALSRRSAS